MDDAPVIVKGLGERYIWVDGVPTRKIQPMERIQIVRLDIIYSDAEFTISSIATSRASAPLPGKTDQSQNEEFDGSINIRREHSPVPLLYNRW